MNVTSYHSATVLARMTIDILTELIPIPCTEHEKLNRLRSLLIEIQAAWFGNSFGSGETFSTPEIWGKMQEAVCLMHRSDDPSKKGIDLKAIASNYELLEQIFIARHWETSGYVLDDSSFVGCDLIQMHRFSALGTLRKVHALHQSILLAKKKELSLKDLKQKLLDAIADDDLSEAFRLLSDNVKTQLEQLNHQSEIIVDSYQSEIIVDNDDRTVEQTGKAAIEEDDRGETEDGGFDELPASKFMTELHEFANFSQSDWETLEGAITDPKTQIIDKGGDTPN